MENFRFDDKRVATDTPTRWTPEENSGYRYTKDSMKKNGISAQSVQKKEADEKPKLVVKEKIGKNSRFQQKKKRYVVNSFVLLYLLFFAFFSLCLLHQIRSFLTFSKKVFMSWIYEQEKGLLVTLIP